MPPLTFNNCTANSFTEKADMLKKTFFLAFLSDLEDYIYSTAKNCSLKITKQEVLTVIHWSKVDKTLGLDEIPNWILQACTDKLLDILYEEMDSIVIKHYVTKIKAQRRKNASLCAKI